MKRGARFRLELEFYNGKWQFWRIEEKGKIDASDGEPLDSVDEEHENRGTSAQ